MSLQENKDIVQRVVDLFNEQKLEQVKECFADDFSNHDPSTPAALDREALIQAFAAWMAGFPDGRVQVEDMIAERDKVVKHWTFHGTQTGEFLGIPATGKKVLIYAATIYRLSGGKIVECWWNYDTMGMMQQLGVIPPMG